MINVGIIGCGFVGGALKDWLEHNNPECKLFISDPPKGYFDDLKEPCIDSPLGAFFLNGWGRRANVSSLAICVNPSGGLNSYFIMPFRKNAHLVMENNADVDVILYYQVDFLLTMLILYLHYYMLNLL